MIRWLSNIDLCERFTVNRLTWWFLFLLFFLFFFHTFHPLESFTLFQNIKHLSNRSVRGQCNLRLAMSLIVNLMAIKSLFRHSLMICAAWAIAWMSRLFHRKSAVLHAWMPSMMPAMPHIMLYHPV